MNEPGRAYRKWKTELGLTYRIKAAFGVRLPFRHMHFLLNTSIRAGERRGQFSVIKTKPPSWAH